MSLQESQGNPKLLLTLSVLLNHRIYITSVKVVKLALSDHIYSAARARVNGNLTKTRKTVAET